VERRSRRLKSAARLGPKLERQVSVIGHEIVSPALKAFLLQNKSTDGHVDRSKLTPDIDHELGMDDSSIAGYQCPEPGGQR